MYVELENKLSLIALEEARPLQKMTACLSVIRKVLVEVREKALATGFIDQAAEVQFFKVVKPRFFSLQVLETELYHLENVKKATSILELQEYYREELRCIGRFFRQYAFQYEYYHHHRNISEFKIGHTKMLTNQLGYVQHNENLNYSNAKFIEL